MTRSRLRILKSLVVVAILGGGVAYFAIRKSASDGPVTFRVGKIDRGSIEQIVTASGQLSAVITVQVGSQVSGIIQKLGADFNSTVKEGQIIAQIEPTRFKANLEQAKASLKNAEASAARARVNHDQAKREYDRARALAEKKVIGEAELDGLVSRHELTKVELQSSEAQVAQARASVHIAKVDLERTTIRSPISGTVLQRAVDVGQTVAASLSAPVLFTIAQDLSKMEVRAAIDEADVGKLKEGLEARFTVDAHPGREFVATIFQIRSNPNVQQNVVTYDAILRVDNPDGRLRPGMTANVRIVTERRENVLRVPNAALRFKPPPDLVLAQTTPSFGAGRRGDGGAAAGEGIGRGGEGRRWRGGEGGGDHLGGGERPHGGAREGGGERGEGRRWRGEGGAERPGGGRFAAGGGLGGGRRDMGRVLARIYRAQGEKVVPISFRPGIADDQYTEIMRGQLEEGEEVVIEAVGPSLQQAPQRSAAPPGAAGRGRGPRFF
jgi:HlyD family secretion protein